MHVIRIITALMTTLLLFGCASHSVVRAPDLNHDLRAQNQQLESKGVYLMARPIHQKDDLESYFDDDLIKRGILPVQINIINKDGDRNYFFRPDSLALYNPQGNRQSQLSLNQVIERTKKSYWRSAGWGVALGVIGAGVSVANVAHTNKIMRATYSDSIVQGGNLNQGNMTEGFAFFDVPKELTSLDGWKIDLLLADPKQGESVAFEYTLSGTVLARKSADSDQQSEEE